MFIDNIKLKLIAGKGGSGAVSFWTEKFVIKGGPDGGDGGRGGSIFFIVDSNNNTLSRFRGLRYIEAKNGQPGEGRKKYGKKGEDIILSVPPGTQIIDEESREVLLDLVEENGEKIPFLSGGKGGLGNTHFKSSRNQRPTYAQPGLKGEEKNICLEMKLIADIGLVGYPNVGKSTIISTISNAKPEVADYEFTTITPKLGVVHVGNYDSFLMADIPGIIENASEGKGLGLKFLKHIERNRVLLILIDINNHRDMLYQYETLLSEIEKYSTKLRNKKFAVVITKIDTLIADEANILINKFIKDIGLKINKNMNKFSVNKRYSSFSYKELKKNQPVFILPISSVGNINIKPLKLALSNLKLL